MKREVNWRNQKHCLSSGYLIILVHKHFFFSYWRMTSSQLCNYWEHPLINSRRFHRLYDLFANFLVLYTLMTLISSLHPNPYSVPILLHGFYEVNYFRQSYQKYYAVFLPTEYANNSIWNYSGSEWEREGVRVRWEWGCWGSAWTGVGVMWMNCGFGCEWHLQYIYWLQCAYIAKRPPKITITKTYSKKHSITLCKHIAFKWVKKAG